MPECSILLQGCDLLTKLNAEANFAPGRMDIKVPLEQACAFQAMLLHQGGEVLSQLPEEVIQRVKIRCLGQWEAGTSKHAC